MPAREGLLELVQRAFGLGARKVTVSTVGFPERLRRIAPTRPPFQLAISLHSPFDEERAELVPAMRGVPVADVLAAGDDYGRPGPRDAEAVDHLLRALDEVYDFVIVDAGSTLLPPTASPRGLKLGFQVTYAARVRQQAEMPTMAVGLMRLSRTRHRTRRSRSCRSGR